MNNDIAQTNAADILGELGLKKYEAETFVALTRAGRGTAKDVSEVADVPRTRVYDAVEQLREYGLVDVQRSNPKQFRAVSTEDAVSLLRERFDDRFEMLGETLSDLDSVDDGPQNAETSVWTTTGANAITNRANGFIDAAEDEIVLVIDKEGRISERMLDRLAAVSEEGVSIYIGTLADSSHEQVTDELPNARVFESGLEWLQPTGDDEDTAIGRLLMVDRETLLLSTLTGQNGGEETAIWSEGVGNGLIVIGRRLLAAGLDERVAGAAE
ncbi:MAG TPA: helix-turn-helix domain-containing protein [Halococcus sp.]|nr:helix-turn-helix domain-containing protein [Halococcus sp.]